MIAYTIIKSTDALALEQSVTLALNEGWRLEGGVSCAYNALGQFSIFAQALSHPRGGSDSVVPSNVIRGPVATNSIPIGADSE